MTFQLLPWVLASLLGIAAWTDGDTTDDPYRWLEDTTGGTRRWTGSRRTTPRPTVKNLASSPIFSRSPQGADPRRASSTPTGAFPTSSRMGKYLLQFLARQAAPAWPVAAHPHRSAGSSQGHAGVGPRAHRRRRAGQGRRRKTGSGTRPIVSSPTIAVCLVKLSRGGADAAVVREFEVDKRAFVKNGFFMPEAKSEVNWRDANSCLRRHRLRPGLDDEVGDIPPVAKLWKRGTPLTERGRRLRGPGRGHGRGRPPRPDARLRARHHHPHADVLHLRDVPPPRREAGQDRQARRRPGLLPPRVAAPPAPHRLEARSAGRRRIRPAHCWPSTWRRSSRGTAASTSCSSRPSGSRWRASARRGTSSSSTSWTTSGAGSRS